MLIGVVYEFLNRIQFEKYRVSYTFSILLALYVFTAFSVTLYVSQHLLCLSLLEYDVRHVRACSLVSIFYRESPFYYVFLVAT